MNHIITNEYNQRCVFSLQVGVKSIQEKVWGYVGVELCPESMLTSEILPKIQQLSVNYKVFAIVLVTSTVIFP